LEQVRLKQDGEVLPSDYASTVQPIAEKRVTLSGYQISKVVLVLVPNRVIIFDIMTS
jgi:hypothetical protein